MLTYIILNIISAIYLFMNNFISKLPSTEPYDSPPSPDSRQKFRHNRWKWWKRAHENEFSFVSFPPDYDRNRFIIRNEMIQKLWTWIYTSQNYKTDFGYRLFVGSKFIIYDRDIFCFSKNQCYLRSYDGIAKMFKNDCDRGHVFNILMPKWPICVSLPEGPFWHWGYQLSNKSV